MHHNIPNNQGVNANNGGNQRNNAQEGIISTLLNAEQSGAIISGSFIGHSNLPTVNANQFDTDI